MVDKYSTILNSEHYKEGKNIADKYGLTSYDDLAKNNKAYVAMIIRDMKKAKKRLEKY